MSYKVIQSRSNPYFKNQRGMKPGFDEPLILVEGVKLIGEALSAGLSAKTQWFCDEPYQGLDCLSYKIGADMYGAISPTRSGNPPLIVFERPLIQNASEIKFGRYLLLDQVQEPGNAGALVRAAAAFGFDGAIWKRPCVYPFHHACIRASAGAVFHLPQFLLEDGALPTGLAFIGASTNATHDLTTFQWPQNMVLVMGNEGHGLSEETERHISSQVRIPINPAIESLNVSGAAHIFMYHISQNTSK